MLNLVRNQNCNIICEMFELSTVLVDIEGKVGFLEVCLQGHHTVKPV